MVKKCGASHCLHESKEFLDGDKTITVGKKTYHTDCFAVQDQITQVCDLFYRKVNPNVVFSSLRKVVNEIVYIKGIAPEVLYFGINYYLENHIPLNYPAGLFYVIQNKRMMEAYHRAAVKKSNYKFEVESDQETQFTYAPKSKKTGFGSVLAR